MSKQETRRETKVAKVREIFRRNLALLPKAGPTYFRKGTIAEMISAAGVTKKSAGVVYNNVKNEFIADEVVDEDMFLHGTAGRGLVLSSEHPWTVVQEWNNSPVYQFDNRNEALEYVESLGSDKKYYAVRKTETLLKAAEKLMGKSANTKAA